nr:c-type cytochrome [Pirellulales bacterium]
VLPLLADADRFTGFAARRLLEQLPIDTWAPAVLKQTNNLAFCRGAVGVLAVSTDPTVSTRVIELCQEKLKASPTMDEQLHLLRIVELAMFHGQLKAENVPTLPAQLLALYPTGDPLANRELVRLLTFLQVDGAADKFAAELKKTDVLFQEKLHITAHAARLNVGWQTAAKQTLLQFYEEARTVKAGYSVDKYIEVFTRDYLAKLSLEERRHLLASGEKWPASALSTLASLPENPGPAVLATIRELDAKVAPQCANSDTFRRLRVGIIAVLGAADEPASQEHLRNIYRDEPEYRDPVAMSLTQHPGGENWNLLVDALRTSEGVAAQEILIALAKVDQRPADAAPYRYAILAGLKLADDGAADAINVLNHWTNSRDQAWSPGPPQAGVPAASGSPNWQPQLAHYQQQYAQKFPAAPPAVLPADEGRDKWSYEELLTFLNSDAGRQGSAVRGEEVFAKAQCASCHRVGTRGETTGPDLTAVARRFQRKEILESIVYPSHDISDQYASRIVLSGGKSYAGLVTDRGLAGVTVLLSTGQKVELNREAIDEIQPSNISAMPTGLLNGLTLEQVADLFLYLGGETPNLAQRPAAGKK